LPASCFESDPPRNRGPDQVGSGSCVAKDPVVIAFPVGSIMIPAGDDARVDRMGRELRRMPALELVLDGANGPGEGAALGLARANAIAVALMRAGAAPRQVHLTTRLVVDASVTIRCVGEDTDHDGIFDRDDKCPFEPETFQGRDDEDGCPDTGH
jgi:hypothetical protein